MVENIIIVAIVVIGYAILGAVIFTGQVGAQSVGKQERAREARRMVVAEPLGTMAPLHRVARLAEALARQWHAGQVEPYGDRRPYVEHLQAVADQVEGDERKAIAWLHDILEDTDATEQTLADAGVPDSMIASVVRLTKVGGSYEAYINSLVVTSDAKARAVKMADLRDHLRPGCPAHLRSRYAHALKCLEAA